METQPAPNFKACAFLRRRNRGLAARGSQGSAHRPTEPAAFLARNDDLRRHAAALIDAAVFSMISPIWSSLTISGGVSSMVSPAGRIMIPSSKKE